MLKSYLFISGLSLPMSKFTGLELSPKKIEYLKYIQEQEGPAEARKMLTELGCASEVIERVCFLIGHHHTFENIEGLDYQILVEADFLVNLYEDGLPLENVQTALVKIFKTPSGVNLCKTMFGLK